MFGVVGVKGGWLSIGAPNTHKISGLSLARHVHGGVHVHWSSQCGTVMSWGLEFWFPALMRV